MEEWQKWFDNRLDNAIEAAEVDSQLEGGNGEHLSDNLVNLLADPSKNPPRFKNDCDSHSLSCRPPLVAGAFH
jgi:hypothetical protein